MKHLTSEKEKALAAAGEKWERYTERLGWLIFLKRIKKNRGESTVQAIRRLIGSRTEEQIEGMIYELGSGEPGMNLVNHAAPALRFAAPVRFTLWLRTKREAELVVNALIELERPLRGEWITKGTPRDIGLADRLAVSRRLLQEKVGLVINSRPQNEAR